LIRLLQNLAKNEIEVDLAGEWQATPVALEKSLELRDFQRMKLNHLNQALRGAFLEPAEIIGFPPARRRMLRFPAKSAGTPGLRSNRAGDCPDTPADNSSKSAWR